MSSTLFYIKQANIEHFRPGLSQHSTWRMCPLKPLQSCQTLHPATVRARYSRRKLWGGTCADIRSQALHLGLLAPANSTHLRPLRIWWRTNSPLNSPTQLALAHAAAAMSSAPTNKVSKRVRGYKELPSVCVSMPTAHNAQNQQSGAAHSRLPTSNTNRARPKVLHRTVTANSSCWTA